MFLLVEPYNLINISGIMDKKKKKDSTKKVSIAIIGTCLILFAVYLFLARAEKGVIESNISLEGNVTDKVDNVSKDCPVSSTGIRLCELSPEQREREELKDRLNAELLGKQNTTDDTDPYAPVNKPSQEIAISATSSVRLKVAIPGSDHAMLVAEDLKNVYGITDVYWSPPNLYDIKYDSARTSVDGILSRDIFKKYNASVVSSK